MKNKIISPSAKALLSMALIGSMFVLNGCGGDSNASSDNSQKPQSMVADAPKDDGQGVGKFKDIHLAPLSEVAAIQGKAVFEAKCTACHNYTAVKKVGPGLLGVTQRRKPAWVMNMITNPQEMTQKDPTAKELLGQHLTQMTFQDVSDDQAKEILEFFRKNDGEGTEQAKK